MGPAPEALGRETACQAHPGVSWLGGQNPKPLPQLLPSRQKVTLERAAVALHISRVAHQQAVTLED